jgi:hypothetical protein
MSSPAYSNEQPNNDKRCSVVRVPLPELGLEYGFNFAGVYLANRSGLKLLEGYFDDIQLTYYSTSKFDNFLLGS